MSEDRKIERRYARFNRRMNKAQGNPKKQKRLNDKYGYDYEGAEKAGMKPDSSGHWESRNPKTGEILKGRRHPTIRRTKKAERALGYKIKRRKGRLYSVKK